jgi:hypothetical protein
MYSGGDGDYGVFCKKQFVASSGFIQHP